MKLHAKTDSGIGTRATFGVIVLQADETLEPEFARLMDLPGIALYHSRIRMSPEINAETLRGMKADLPLAAAMFPAAARFDVIGYGCTSAATVIGPEGVRDAIQSVHPDALVTEPLSALVAGCEALDLKRVAFLTPYVPDVSARMRARLEADGLSLSAFASFEESDDRVVARITEESILRGIEHVAGMASCDGVIVACTNLRVANIAAKAEAKLGIPVLSSNLALSWHMLKLAGISAPRPAFGRLHGAN